MSNTFDSAMIDASSSSSASRFCIPEEIYFKYFNGSQNLFYQVYNKKTDAATLKNLHILLQKAYHQLFDSSIDTIPSFLLDGSLSKDVKILRQALEDALLTNKLSSVMEFESFIDTIIQAALEQLRLLVKQKNLEFRVAQGHIRQVCTEIVSECMRRLTRMEKLKFIEKNETTICRDTLAKINTPQVKVDEVLRLVGILCDYTDRYHKPGMRKALTQELNCLLRRTAEYSAFAIRDYLGHLFKDDLCILKNLHSLLDDNYFTTLREFSFTLDSFFQSLFSRFEALLRFKLVIMDKLKRAIIASATESIFEDLDRLPQ